MHKGHTMPRVSVTRKIKQEERVIKTRNLSESRMQTSSLTGEESSRWSEKPGQRPWEGTSPGALKEQKEGCSSKHSEGRVRGHDIEETIIGISCRV